MRMVQRFFIFVAIVILLPLPRAAAQSVAELRIEAKSAFRSGDYEKAASLYNQLVSHAPERLNVLKEAMWAFWNMGRITDAQSMANAVQSLAPEDEEAEKILGWAPAALNRRQITGLHAQAKAAYQRGDYEEAAQLFRQITSLDPKNIPMLRDRMWILWNMKRTGEAAEIAQQVLRFRPGDRDAQSILDRAPNVEAKIKKNIPASREMILELQEKVAADPGNVTAHRQLAWSLFNTGRITEAEAVLRKFLKENPENAEIWLQLGKIQEERGNEEGANESYLRSLALDPKQPQLLAAIGRRHFTERNLNESVRFLERAVALESNESQELLPILAKSLFYRGEYRRSAEAWAQAIDVFPDRSDYRFYEAEAIFHAGDEGLALAKMRQLKYEYREPRAIAFLVDNAVARGDYSAAAIILAEDLDRLSIEKGRKVIRLANIYVKLNRLNDAISVLKRWVNFVPRDVWALLTLGGIENDASRHADAVKTYERVLRLNPRVIEAHNGLAEAYFGLGEPEKGVTYLSKALSLEPTNPHMIRDYAWALFSNGQRRQARQILLDWIKENENKTVMPIILYHGLTPFDDSPMLGYEIHTTITAFENQMRGLREAGYEPVTMRQVADWHDGKDTVPEKPIFITFDDARMDGFRYADPILDQYGFHATMFIPLEDVESFGSIGYANWPKIQEYQKTGRWHFEAHGAKAHSKITVDSRGRKMLYLIMPEWLPNKNRVETDEKWQQRIDEDHRLIKRRLKQMVKVDSIGYAWPEGNYGEHSDSPAAIDYNLSAVKDHFRFAFVQDQYGLNVRSQDPYFLHRIEPPKEWSGKDLVAHIANKNPLALVYRQLLQMALEEKKLAEAKQWLKKLKEAGVSEHVYLNEEARINYASGRSSKAYQLALLSFTTEPTAEAQKMLTEFKSRTGIAWRPTVAFQHDNQARESLSFEQEVEVPMALQLKALAHHGRAKYRENDVETVYETRWGGGVQLGWGNGHTLKGLLIHHAVSGPADDLLGYAASYWARWSDRFRTRVEARRSFHGGARAITDNIRENHYRLTAHVGEKDEWGLRLRGRHLDFSDDNERRTVEVETGAPFWHRPVAVGPFYRYSFDDTTRLASGYYSPQDLHIHELGPQVVWASQSKFKFIARYLPGVSKEKDRSDRFVQSVDAMLSWSLTPNAFLSPSFYYVETGSYYYNLSSAELEVRF